MLPIICSSMQSFSEKKESKMASTECIISHLIETMKIPFAALLHYYSRFFQKIIIHVTSDWIAFEIEIDIHILSESRRIVVSIRLCITKRFQYRIRLNQYIFYPVNDQDFRRIKLTHLDS